MDTHALRKTIRKHRRTLGAARQAIAAESLKANLESLECVRNAKRLGLYLVNDGEIDPEHFMHWAWRQQKQCYLPVLHEQNDQPMYFAEITPQSTFLNNRFDIPEPVTDNSLRANQLDIILMPLVAFDAKGNRIGMGGGYYDRTLAFKRAHPYDRRPVLIGLAHEFQCLDEIKPAPWDIPLDGIVTDERATLFEQQST